MRTRLLTLVVALCAVVADSAVEVYTWPAGIAPGSVFTSVEVAGVNSPVIKGHAEDLTTFSFTGTVTVKVTCKAEVSSVKIRPQRRAIQPVISGATVTFSLDRPENLCVEVNANRDYPLFLFANPIEARPDPADPAVRYFAAGQVYDVGNLQVLPSSPHTIFIEGGAIVRGNLTAFNHDGDNLKILGRGIFENQGYTAQLMNVSNANNFSVSGVILRNVGPQWTCFLTANDSLLFDNVKILTYHMLNDGMDLCGCHGATIRNCFFRTNDDCISPKANEWTGQRTTQNVRISHCVFWKDTFGMVFRIGGETNAPLFDSITISDCDIIRCRSWGTGSEVAGGFRIDDEQGASVTRMRIEEITFEEPECNHTARFSVRSMPGTVSDVLFRNIRFLGDTTLPFLFEGMDAASHVKNVTIDGVYLNGDCRPASDVAIQKNQYTSNISLLQCPSAVARLAPVARATGRNTEMQAPVDVRGRHISAASSASGVRVATTGQGVKQGTLR